MEMNSSLHYKPSECERRGKNRATVVQSGLLQERAMITANRRTARASSSEADVRNERVGTFSVCVSGQFIGVIVASLARTL